jgi:hypothetical protein
LRRLCGVMATLQTEKKGSLMHIRALKDSGEEEA